MSSSRIVAEIKQSKPFASVEQEAVVALLKTVDHVRHMQAGLFCGFDLTEQQFNVLRILRGAGPEGLPTLTVGERLIEHTPGITRLIDRLEAKGLVRRERPEQDRRQVYCFITKAGLDLLVKVDPEVDLGAKRAMKHLSKTEMQTLLGLLEKIRDSR
jgi:MarR family transcriptional regulator, organic hydroperoxide resistance regulator